MKTLFGVPVVPSELATQPKMWELPVFQLRPWVTVSDEFRAEMDSWLRDHFGTSKKETVEHGREPGCFVVDLSATGLGSGMKIFVHPKIYHTLLEQNVFTGGPNGNKTQPG